MAWNLKKFRNNVGPISQNHNFLIDFSNIDFIKKKGSDLHTALCRSTEVPAKILESQNMAYYGMDYKLCTRASYTDWTVTFLETEDSGLRDDFIAWMDAAYDIKKLKVQNKHLSYKKDKVTVTKEFLLSSAQQAIDKKEEQAHTSPNNLNKFEQEKLDEQNAAAKAKASGKSSKNVLFYGMFPTNVGPLNFDQTGGNVLTFDVTLTYDFYDYEEKPAKT